jgi:hypothetical protein
MKVETCILDPERVPWWEAKGRASASSVIVWEAVIGVLVEMRELRWGKCRAGRLPSTVVASGSRLIRDVKV